MIIGIMLLLLISLLIYFGILQRVLDNLYLNDRQALAIIFFMILGSFINLTVSTNPLIKVNLGGIVIPVALAIYVFLKADQRAEKIRTIFASLLTGATIYVYATFLNDFTLPSNDFIDSSIFYAIIAGVFAYMFGRSRRGAFLSALGGLLIYNGLVLIKTLQLNQPTEISLGGAGIFDSFVISSFLALAFTEFYGEVLERLFGKTQKITSNKEAKNHEK